MREKPKSAPVALPNLLDRAIGYVAPRIAARRMVARQYLAVAGGGYSGARRDKATLAGWRTSAGSPETDVIADLPTLRDRCADLERNAPVAAAVIGTNEVHVVGTGLACVPQIDADFLGLTKEDAEAWQVNTRRRFNAWAESPDCDLARRLTFYGIQGLALRTTMSRGDGFVLTPRVERAGRRGARLALQLLEGDRVANPMGKSNTDTLTEGIEHSPDTGEALSVYVLDRHPGDMRGGARTGRWVQVRGERTGRRNVLHLMRQIRADLRRGVPILAPVIEPIKQVTRYTNAELEAAVVSGLFAVFLKMDPKAFDEMFEDGDQKSYLDRASKWSGELEGGKAINLLPGEEPVPSNPGRPNAQFDPFVTACFRQIGMALGMPYEVLVMAFQSSYSAAKGALLMAWRFFMGWRNWLATELCQPVYELWLADEVAEGRIGAPGFFADEVVRAAWCGCSWVGDGPGSLDPMKDASAAEKRIEIGISTTEAESLLHDGVSWEVKHRQELKTAEARREAGLRVIGAEDAPPAAPPQPEPTNTENA